ncbi:hypothetical protein PMAYCL1PPCAC_04642, partial [Pristionchus mayeri]
LCISLISVILKPSAAVWNNEILDQVMEIGYHPYWENNDCEAFDESVQGAANSQLLTIEKELQVLKKQSPKAYKALLPIAGQVPTCPPVLTGSKRKIRAILYSRNCQS